MSQMRVAAAVLAGGKGTRFTGDCPKQYALLNGKPVLWYAVEAFCAAAEVDAVYLVVPAADIDKIEAWRATCGWTRVTRVVAGGANRAGSTLAALAAAEADGCTHILLHDAARPLLESAVIQRMVEALKTDAAATAAIPATDTIAVADGAGGIASLPRRETLWQVQTPQGFCVEVLRRAYTLAQAQPALVATDDCGVVRTYLPEVPIRLVTGSRRAWKLTYPEDLTLLSAWSELPL